jgi:hypothetical protein
MPKPGLLRQNSNIVQKSSFHPLEEFFPELGWLTVGELAGLP